MTTIQDFSYLRVPEKISFCSGNATTSLPGSELITPTVVTMKASQYVTGWESLGEASNMIKNIGKGHQLGEWINGNEDKSPFKEKEISQVKKNTTSLWNQFSTSVFAQTLVQTILIANSYLEYFSFLSGSKKPPGNTPFWDMIVPAAKLYNGVQKTFSGISDVNRAKSDNKVQAGYGKLLSGAADSLGATSKLFAIYMLYQLSPLAELAFMTLSFVGNIFEVSGDSKARKMESLDQMVRQVPKAMILA